MQESVFPITLLEFLTQNKKTSNKRNSRSRGFLLFDDFLLLLYTIQKEYKGEINMAFCINCGTKLPEGAKFCLDCGTKVPTYRDEDKPAQENVQTSAQTDKEQEKEERNNSPVQTETKINQTTQQIKVPDSDQIPVFTAPTKETANNKAQVMESASSQRERKSQTSKPVQNPTIPTNEVDFDEFDFGFRKENSRASEAKQNNPVFGTKNMDEPNARKRVQINTSTPQPSQNTKIQTSSDTVNKADDTCEVYKKQTFLDSDSNNASKKEQESNEYQSKHTSDMEDSVSEADDICFDNKAPDSKKNNIVKDSLEDEGWLDDIQSKDVMNRNRKSKIHIGVEDDWFDEPSSIQKKTIEKPSQKKEFEASDDDWFDIPTENANKNVSYRQNSDSTTIETESIQKQNESDDFDLLDDESKEESTNKVKTAPKPRVRANSTDNSFNDNETSRWMKDSSNSNISPDEDPYWNDVLPEIEEEIYKIPKEIFVKIFGSFVALIAVIAWLVFMIP